MARSVYAPTRRELEETLVACARADPRFLEQLKADPHAAVALATGVEVPASITIEVLEETPETAYFVIPLDREAAPDDEAGGGADYWAGVNRAGSNR